MRLFAFAVAAAAALLGLAVPSVVGQCDKTIAAIARLNDGEVLGFAAFGVYSDCSLNATVYLQGAGELCTRTDPCDVNIHARPIVDGDCATAGDVWDPTSLLPAPNCTTDSPAECAAGQLSAKHGRVTLDPHRLSFTDAFVALEGRRSVVGRSVVVTRSSDGARVLCGTLVRNSTVGSVRLAASAGGVSVEIVQQTGGPLMDADITVTATSAQTSTAWSIATTCTNTTNPWNPSSVDGSQCGEDAQGECAMGALTAKHGPLQLAAGEAVLVTDTNLNAQHDAVDSVVGKCLVVGGSTATIAVVAEDCSGTPLSATATFSGDITGTITFSQPPNLACPTTIAVDLQGLQGNNAYHVHEFPNDDPDMTGAIFNPFALPTNQYDCDPSNPRTCYIGDLSGKHGALATASVTSTHTDGTLPLSGRHSIAFHALVVHGSDGSRWESAQIVPTGAEVKRLMVVYGPEWASGAVLGNVTFYQSAHDSTAITGIHVRARYNQGGSGYAGMWHVHQASGDDDNKCINIGGHFNPFAAMVGCSPLVPEFCEVGDFSGKHGLLALPSPNSGEFGEFLFMDAQLPLTGDLSIEGKAAVVHYYNGDTLACGDLFDPDQGYPTPYPAPESPTPHPSPDSTDDDLSGGEIAAIAIFVGLATVVGAALAYSKLCYKAHPRSTL